MVIFSRLAPDVDHQKTRRHSSRCCINKPAQIIFGGGGGGGFFFLLSQLPFVQTLDIFQQKSAFEEDIIGVCRVNLMEVDIL